MILPDEYKLGDNVKESGNLQIYRATHPIHNQVRVYLPKSDLPNETRDIIYRELYSTGLLLQEVTLMNIPYVAKTLDISRNPEKPYIVTEDLEYDLQDAIDNRIGFKPTRVFSILSQILECFDCLLSNGFFVHKITPNQILIPSYSKGDVKITFTERTIQKGWHTVKTSVMGKTVAIQKEQTAKTQMENQ